jgi:hypothetical protein
MNLKMDEGEILMSYRDAKNRFMQVKVLADLNCVSNREMAEWLRDHGEAVDKRYFAEMRTKKIPMQTVRRVGENVYTATIKPVTAPTPEPVAEPDQTAKADAGKPRLSLVPPELIWQVAAVREYGCSKYPEGGKDNWRDVEPERYVEALFRHTLRTVEEWDGLDDESGLYHLAHVATNAAFLLQMLKERRDR